MRPVVSDTAEELYAALGPWASADGEASGWALLHFCQAITLVLDKTNKLIRDTPTRDGWGDVMDPNTAPPEWLPWLGQFVGTTVNTFQTEENQRASVLAEQGQGRGTVGYLRSALQRQLQGTQRVDITERDTSPYHFAVRVYRGELAGMHYGSLDASYRTYAAMDAAFITYADMTVTETPVRDAASTAKPAGLIMDMTVTPGLPA